MRWLLFGLVLCPGLALAAVGSWSGTLPGVRVGGPDRNYATDMVVPFSTFTPAWIHRVQWRYKLPAGKGVLAFFCVQSQCSPIKGQSGRSMAFAGQPMNEPVYLYFRLPENKRSSVQVSAIQLIIEYQPEK